MIAQANRFGIGSANVVIEQVVTAIASWQAFVTQADVPKDQANYFTDFHLLGLGQVTGKRLIEIRSRDHVQNSPNRCD